VMVLVSVLLPLIVPPAGSVLIGSPSAVSWPLYVTPNIAWTDAMRAIGARPVRPAVSSPVTEV